MTREEAKALLLNISAYDIDSQRGMEKQEALEMAIKALEQEPILDKIRAEVEAYQSDAFYHSDVMLNKRMVLEIIDKYRTESEGKE